MGKKRMIDTDFWTDSWVVDNLDPLEAHLFIYLFTNPQTTLAGVYQLSPRIMSFQTGFEKDKLLTMLKRLEPKVFYVDGWIILANCIKNQNYRNSKIATGILAALDGIPDEILQHVNWPKDFGHQKPKGSNQTKIFDESSMSHDESLHLNETKNKNKTETKTRPPAAAASPSASPESNKFDKKRYAQAVRADEAQADRARSASTRKPSGVKSASELFGGRNQT